MNSFGIFRVERLKTMGNVKSSGLHSFREIAVDNADSEKKADNYFPDLDSSEKLYLAVSSRISELDRKDKQACRCLEFFVGASPEQFLENGKLHDLSTRKQYFDSALDFIKNKHGAENVVCSVIHNDEKSPHMIVYAVPVVRREAHTRKRSVAVKASEGGGRREYTEQVPALNELSAKAYYHCPAALSKLQDDFYAGVSKSFDLDRGISRVEGRKHKKTSVYYAEKNAELDAKAAELSLREEDVVANFAKIDRHWEIIEDDKLRLAALLVDLDQREAALADGLKHLERISRGLENTKAGLDQREAAVIQDRKGLDYGLAKLALDRANLIAGFKKLEDEKTEHLGFVNRIKIKLDQREAELTKREADMVHRVFIEKVEPMNVKIEVFHQERAAFREEMKPLLNYPPAQVAEFAQEMQKRKIAPGKKM